MGPVWRHRYGEDKAGRGSSVHLGSGHMGHRWRRMRTADKAGEVGLRGAAEISGLQRAGGLVEGLPVAIACAVKQGLSEWGSCPRCFLAGVRGGFCCGLACTDPLRGLGGAGLLRDGELPLFVFSSKFSR